MDLSGFTLPNQFIAVMLLAFDELMGTNGLHALLNAAGLKDWIENPPLQNEERDIDFRHVSLLTRSLIDLYGEKGSQSLMRPANHRIYQELWAADSRFEFAGKPEQASLDPAVRLEKGLGVFAEVLAATSDVIARIETKEKGVHFALEQCPYCWGLKGKMPQCTAFIGLLESAARHFAPDASVLIEESECTASGSENCVFAITLQN